jgi:hypothetical protein
MPYIMRDSSGSEFRAPSYLSALQGAVAWSRAIGAPVEVFAAGPVGYPLLRTVHPTDTLVSLTR